MGNVEKSKAGIKSANELLVLTIFAGICLLAWYKKVKGRTNCFWFVLLQLFALKSSPFHFILVLGIGLNA